MSEEIFCWYCQEEILDPNEMINVKSIDSTKRALQWHKKCAIKQGLINESSQRKDELTQTRLHSPQKTGVKLFMWKFPIVIICAAVGLIIGYIIGALWGLNKFGDGGIIVAFFGAFIGLILGFLLALIFVIIT